MWVGYVSTKTSSAVVMPPTAWGPDAERIDRVEQFVFERRHLRVGVARADLAEERVLGDGHGLFGGAADANADNQGRAGISAGHVDGFADEVDDGGLTHAGQEVLVARHVFAAATLGHEVEADLVAGDDLGVDDAGRVVAGVLPCC